MHLCCNFIEVYKDFSNTKIDDNSYYLIVVYHGHSKYYDFFCHNGLNIEAILSNGNKWLL